MIFMAFMLPKSPTSSQISNWKLFYAQAFLSACKHIQKRREFSLAQNKIKWKLDERGIHSPPYGGFLGM